MMQRGLADVIFAGGSEAAVTRIGFAGFSSMKAMSTKFNDEPARASRPFDAEQGWICNGRRSWGFGSGNQRDRQKNEVPEFMPKIVGYSATCDAFHVTTPDTESKALTKCMNQAIEQSKVPSESVDYVNAHGTSTPYNDRSETSCS